MPARTGVDYVGRKKWRTVLRAGLSDRPRPNHGIPSLRTHLIVGEGGFDGDSKAARTRYPLVKARYIDG